MRRPSVPAARQSARAAPAASLARAPRGRGRRVRDPPAARLQPLEVNIAPPPQRKLPKRAAACRRCPQVTLRLLVQNVGNVPTPKARVAAWANASDPLPCGAKGDAAGSVPALQPLESAWIQVKVKMPEAPGLVNSVVFIDSECTVFNGSNTANQLRKALDVTGTPAEYPRLVFPESLVNYETGNIYRWAEVAPPLPVSGQNFSVKLRWGARPFGVLSGAWDSGERPAGAAGPASLRGRRGW